VKPTGAFYTVSRVASLAGLTIRTLHHYDRIRLVRPSGRSRAGYRQYSRADLLRLQQVMFFRELGFPLAGIRRIMSASTFEARRALVAQRAMLVEKAGRIQAMVAAVDRALATHVDGGATMGERNEKEMFAMFGKFDPKQYEDEARRRWGQTPAYAEAGRRTARYGQAEWAAIKAEAAEISNAMAAKLEGGVPSNDPAVMDLAERHRQHITRWFYPCPPEMHANLGRMYVADERFAANYESVRAGLAVYVRDAIVANAARVTTQD
jgi:DNA-binding transcriptional MerR regulator